MLPTLIECNHMPDDRSEIPTPVAAQHHTHLKSIAHKIPQLDPEAQILLLLGRDILQVHKVREQRNGPHSAPYAQRLDLGWVVIVKEKFSTKAPHCSSLPGLAHDPPVLDDCSFGSTIFERTKDDDKVGLSIEDRLFLELMDKEMFMDNTNSWVAPLPFRSPRRRLPNNREQALSRLTTLRRTLERKPELNSHFNLDFDDNSASIQCSLGLSWDLKRDIFTHLQSGGYREVLHT
ncbi:hypothetical protein SKAU_G00245450 [Synaphobranchus kaupii]|uniref:Uncharacterized protein n=1 Tax=Synaphobranchus kaupii TaxID=118154 RepID=A0A9Q1IRC6_SYNKA|nr:hypothetical protein SKAU_G00245450 [Synaphobranchus kaupii]